MNKFAKQRFVEARVNGQRQFIRITRENGDFLIGMRVNRHGVDIERETKDAIQKFLVVFQAANIIREMRMSLHYASLVPMDQAARPDTADAEESED